MNFNDRLLTINIIYDILFHSLDIISFQTSIFQKIKNKK